MTQRKPARAKVFLVGKKRPIYVTDSVGDIAVAMESEMRTLRLNTTDGDVIHANRTTISTVCGVAAEVALDYNPLFGSKITIYAQDDQIVVEGEDLGTAELLRVNPVTGEVVTPTGMVPQEVIDLYVDAIGLIARAEDILNREFNAEQEAQAKTA